MINQLLLPWTNSHSSLLLSHQSSCRNRDFVAKIHGVYPLTMSLFKLERQTDSCLECKARRRARLIEDDDEDDEDEYGYNEEIAMLEMYTQSVRNEALIVNAVVDDEEVQVIIFKGFSSCLSYRTSSDLSRSVLPPRAVIKSIDRIKGPFDPSNVQFLEQNLSFQTFKNRLQQK